MKTERPWGWYDVINEGSSHKVKCIEVKPGLSLSLQRHMHRSEHWVVVEGTALVEVDGKKEFVNVMKVHMFLYVLCIDYLILAKYLLKL